MEAPHITQLREQGYAVVRGFLPADKLAGVADAVDEMYAEGMTHHATYRDRNLCFEVLNDHPEPFYIEDDWMAEESAV